MAKYIRDAAVKQTAAPLTPPGRGLFVGAVWFEGGPGGRIVGFNVVGPKGNTVAVRGRVDRKFDECVPVGVLSDSQLALCRAWRPDGVMNVLADYFLPK